MKQSRTRHRKIIVYADYFKNFRKTINKEALKKIYEVMTYIMTEETIPSKFFKSITGYHGLFEIRVEYESNIYRIFCCIDKGNLIVLFNGYTKKSQKAPTNELEKANRIMKEYFQSKTN